MEEERGVCGVMPGLYRSERLLAFVGRLYRGERGVRVAMPGYSENTGRWRPQMRGFESFGSEPPQLRDIRWAKNQKESLSRSG